MENNKKPNIILITVDALRADKLGFMGCKKNITPNLDRFAEESIKFTNAFTTGSYTPYSFPAILTSSYPLDYQGPFKVERPRVMVSEVFKQHGFQTAAFHSGPYLSEFFGYNKGWDFFKEIDYPLPEEVGYRIGNFLFSLKKNFINLFSKVTLNFYPHLFFAVVYLNYRITKKRVPKVNASFVNQTVRDFFRFCRDEEKPLLLWIYYMDVHGPYFPYDFYFQERTLSYPELLGKGLPSYILDYYSSSSAIFKKFCNKHIDSSINLYEQGIKYADKKIGELFKFLKKKNIYQNSVIFFTADHGTEFLEHGGAEHHMGKLYNELLHVPLLVKIPGGQNTKTIREKVSLIDIAPTMCDLAAVKRDPSFKGGNLFDAKNDLIFHQAGIAKREDIWNIEVEELSRCKVACQSMDWKYILNYKSRKEELYDLRNDPKEQKDISRQEPKVLSVFRKKIEEFEKKNPPLPMN